MAGDKRFVAFTLLAAALLIFFLSTSIGAYSHRGALPETGTVSTPFPGFPMDINSASLRELITLPGVGEKTALNIIEERERRGGFGSVDELIEVRWLGESKLERLRGLVTVSPLGEGPDE